MRNNPIVAIVGLGYVGLPVAVAFAEGFPGTIGFDKDGTRVAALQEGRDWTGEMDEGRLRKANLRVSADPKILREADIFVICVPTPVLSNRRPDLRPLANASETVGRALSTGAIVCYESTVYPGVTEEYCGPILAQASGLARGRDFKLGYSPERINPGDKTHTFENVRKVVSGEDASTTEALAKLYGTVVKAGVHVAPSIKVAEAAKVIENAQRDLNIAFMNELAIICDLINVSTRDVLDAAATKWNFLNFRPGLVGGHCIGVDPYYLTSMAEELGYHPEVILAGRRINDSMGGFVARKLIRLMNGCSRPLRELSVGVLGVTFKEDISDVRNSRVPDILKELKSFGIGARVSDCYANPAEVEAEYGVILSDIETFKNLDVLVLAVAHKVYLENPQRLLSMIRPGGAVMDIKSVVNPADVPSTIQYWSL